MNTRKVQVSIKQTNEELTDEQVGYAYTQVIKLCQELQHTEIYKKVIKRES